MGGKRSSSKRKSSKRKSSKLAYEGPRKKRSRRTKSKKLRHRDDSSSDSSDDSSSVSISSSSFEDEYRRADSRTSSGVKGSSRKRTRRSTCSHGSSEENSHHVKKRKASKRSANSDSKKKSQKKRRKREPSISSISSDSRSCSTCRGESSNGGDGEFKRDKARFREKSKEKRDFGKAKGDQNRSKSSPPCARLIDSGDHNSNEVLPVENSVRRLRSVIIVPKSAEDEEKEWEKDGQKEEIACDHVDYPSCRNNDCNEGGSKTEIASPDPHDKRVKNVRRVEALVSDIVITENEKTREGGIQVSQSKSLSDWSGANDYNKETKVDVFPTVSGANGDDDLESVLRLKALENMKKYLSVRIQTNAKLPTDEITKSCNKVKRLSTAKVDFVQKTSNNEDDSTIVCPTRVLDQNRRSKMGRDLSSTAARYGKGQEGQSIVTERETARGSLISLPNKLSVSGNSKKEEPSSPASDFELGKSALRQEPSEAILNHAQKANMLLSEADVEKRSVETCKGASQIAGDNDRANYVGKSSISEPSSSLKPTFEEQNSKDQQRGQFQQKTMSVMRGGEMVEVSYKVYIPKKAPSLARRHLRR